MFHYWLEVTLFSLCFRYNWKQIQYTIYMVYEQIGDHTKVQDVIGIMMLLVLVSANVQTK